MAVGFKLLTAKRCGWRHNPHPLVNFLSRSYMWDMSRVPVAIIAGLVGFALYVAGVMLLGDYVVQWHWTLQAVFFVVAGTLWVLPARWLMFWGAGMR